MKTLHQFDEVFDTQAVFRKVLEAMSNPTRTVSVAEQMEKLFGNHRAFLALGMTLLDNEATFSACGDADFRNDFQLVTLSQEKAVSEADYLFVTDAKNCRKCWHRQSVEHWLTRTKVQPCSFGTTEKQQKRWLFMVRELTEKQHFLVPVLSVGHWNCVTSRNMNTRWVLT